MTTAEIAATKQRSPAGQQTLKITRDSKVSPSNSNYRQSIELVGLHVFGDLLSDIDGLLAGVS